MSLLNDEMTDLHRDFIKSNDEFITRNAKLSLEEVKRPKSRDRFIQEEIQMKSDLAENFGLTQFDKDYYDKQIKMKAREMQEGKNPLLSRRQVQNTGGLLQDDNDRYGMKEGGPGIEALRKEAPEVVERMGYEEGGPLSEEPMMEEPMMTEPMVEEPMMEQPEEDMMPEEEMLPDDEMEDEYLDFILDEALDNEEEEYLMSQLQDNERLSEIFDKVIDVAQEFAGSGPVEGPGSGVSDSIPARLSDGEFVFTAKAVEEIGADNLMAMMKDAEMKADERQGLAEGGQPEEEETVVMPVEQPASQQDIRVTKTTVGAEASQQEVNDLVDEEVKKSMLRGSRNLG
jgi:hypothetical protein